MDNGNRFQILFGSSNDHLVEYKGEKIFKEIEQGGVFFRLLSKVESINVLIMNNVIPFYCL